jgi:hypothetical protein
VQDELESKFVSYVPVVDDAAKTLFENNGENHARQFLSEFSINEANNMTKRWKELGQYLLVKYLDGNIKREKDGEFERTEFGLPPSPIFAGYPEWWYEAIVKSTGDQFKVIGKSAEH